jgi:hypothetical protein
MEREIKHENLYIMLYERTLNLIYCQKKLFISTVCVGNTWNIILVRKSEKANPSQLIKEKGINIKMDLSGLWGLKVNKTGSSSV